MGKNSLWVPALWARGRCNGTCKQIRKHWLQCHLTRRLSQKPHQYQHSSLLYLSSNLKQAQISIYASSLERITTSFTSLHGRQFTPSPKNVRPENESFILSPPPPLWRVYVFKSTECIMQQSQCFNCLVLVFIKIQTQKINYVKIRRMWLFRFIFSFHYKFPIAHFMFVPLRKCLEIIWQWEAPLSWEGKGGLENSTHCNGSSPNKACDERTCFQSTTTDEASKASWFCPRILFTLTEWIVVVMIVSSCYNNNKLHWSGTFCRRSNDIQHLAMQGLEIKITVIGIIYIYF